MLRDYITVPARSKGWKDKYVVYKRDEKDQLRAPDPEAIYFPLRLDTDPRAREAALFYAGMVESMDPELAAAIREKVAQGEETQIRNSGYAE